MRTSGTAKGQAATELLITYSWAFIIIGIVVGLAYYFYAIPTQSVPKQCIFQYNINCKILLIGTSRGITKVAMLLVNSQIYPIKNPTVTVDLGSFGKASNTCSPTVINAGGYILCNVTSPTAVPVGSTVDGTIYLNLTACPSGNPNNCQPAQPQGYIGNFTAQVGSVIPIITTTSSTSITSTI